MSESVGRGGRSAAHRDVRRFPEQTSGFTWKRVVLTMYPNRRFEKEFDGVQDVFELQV